MMVVRPGMAVPGWVEGAVRSAAVLVGEVGPIAVSWWQIAELTRECKQRVEQWIDQGRGRCRRRCVSTTVVAVNIGQVLVVRIRCGRSGRCRQCSLLMSNGGKMLQGRRRRSGNADRGRIVRSHGRHKAVGQGKGRRDGRATAAGHRRRRRRGLLTWWRDGGRREASVGCARAVGDHMAHVQRGR